MTIPTPAPAGVFFFNIVINPLAIGGRIFSVNWNLQKHVFGWQANFIVTSLQAQLDP